MPLNPPLLSAEMLAAVDQATLANPLANPAQRKAIYDALAQAICAHIIANGLVVVTVASVSGVTVGPGVSGPGAGTGMIT